MWSRWCGRAYSRRGSAGDGAAPADSFDDRARHWGREFARTGASSNGTPEAAAKARGVQSECARNRRATLSDRILDATEKSLDLLEKCAAPPDRQFLSQALRNHTTVYSDLMTLDVKAAPHLSVVVSVIERFTANAQMLAESVLSAPRAGLIQ